MLFDTHAHYYDERFNEDRDKILSSFPQNGIGYVVNAGCDVKTTKECIKLSEKYPFVYSLAGIHPHDVNDATDEDYNEIFRLAQHKKVCAIGEIGLDYHYENIDKKVQKNAFARQMDMADSLKLPFVIHCRDACGDCLDILKSKYKGGGAAMHCFSESKETAKIVLDMGLFVSIAGPVTFKNNVRTVEAVRYIPLDRLLIETDAPYLAPTPHRGERNSSLYLGYIAERIAEIKGISRDEVEKATFENARKFFSI